LGRQDDFRSWLACGGDQTLRSYGVLHFARFPHPSGCETSGKSKTQGDNGLFRAADEWSGNQNHADFPWKTANPGLRKSRNVQGVAHPRSIPQRHRSFVNSFEDHHESETHLFVHAGYQPDLYLCKQPGSVLRRRPLDGDWPGPHASGKVAVVGHTRQKGGEILDLGHLVCIDTNSHGGGWLTALDVGSGRYWQANQQGQVREGRLANAAASQGAEAQATRS